MTLRRLAPHSAVLALMAALAVAYTWPLAAHPRTHYAVRLRPPAPLSADLLFSSWILASDVHRLLHDPLRVFEANNLHPFRHSLAFGENLLGVAVLVLPVQVLWDNPTLTHNVAALLTLTLGGWGMFLLVRELGGSVLAGLVAGALIVYSPATWAHVILLPMMAWHWTPVALFLLVRLVRDPRWRWSLLLAVVVAWQAWSSLQHGLFLGLGLGTTALVLLVLGRALGALPHLVAAGVLAGLLCVPLAVPYRAVTREMDTQARAGALYFSLRLDRDAPRLDRPLAYLAERARSGEHVQGYAALAPWLLLLAGGAAAAIRRRPRTVEARILVALAAGGLANFFLALGPVPNPWLPNLYDSVTSLVPPLAWVRVPARAASHAYLVVCALAGAGLAALFRRVPGPRAAAAVVACAAVLIVLDAGWRPIPLAPAPPRWSPLSPALRALPSGCAIADIPANLDANGLALFRSTVHWRPVINGFSGFFPVPTLVSFALLNPFPSPDSLAFVRAAGACAVVVRGEETGAARLEAIVRESRDLGMLVEQAGAEALIHLPPAAPSVDPVPLPSRGWRVEPAGAEAAVDGDLATMWHASAAGFPPDRLTVDLGVPARVARVTLELGHHLTLYMRSYRVEGSADGAAWTTLAESALAVPPLESYRADWQRVRQQIAFPPAVVRFLRIGPYRRAPQRGLTPDAGWSRWGVAELTVGGVPADGSPTGAATPP